MSAPMCGVTVIPAGMPIPPLPPPHRHHYVVLLESLVCEGCGKSVTA